MLIAVLLALFARSFLLQAFRIPSESMEPSLIIGDQILVNKFIYGPTLYDWERSLLPIRPVARGDVVVFRFPESPEQEYIKRCVARSGDRVLLRDKVLILNGQEIQEGGTVQHEDARTYPNSLILPDHYRFRDNYGPYTVPPDTLFFLGDNRDLSHDSRYWGPVSSRLVRGRALLIYWSFETDSDHGRSRRGAARWLRDALSGTRWDRSLKLVR